MILRQKHRSFLGAGLILCGVLASPMAHVQAAPVTPDALPDSGQSIEADLSDVPLNRLLSITLEQLGTLAIDLAPKPEGVSGSINFSGQSPSAKRCQIEFNGTRRSDGADIRLNPGAGRSECGFDSEAAVKLDRSQGKGSNTVTGTFTLGGEQRGSFNLTLPR